MLETDKCIWSKIALCYGALVKSVWWKKEAAKRENKWKQQQQQLVNVLVMQKKMK